MDADGCEFFCGARGGTHPEAMLAFDARGLDAVFGGSLDHHFFELLDVPADVAAMRGQIHDRIADDLAWTVIGDVAAAIGFAKFDVHLIEQVAAGSKILSIAVAAEGDDV